MCSQLMPTSLLAWLHITVLCFLGDRSHTIERHHNVRTTEKEEHHEFVNLDESRSQFHQSRQLSVSSYIRGSLQSGPFSCVPYILRGFNSHAFPLLSAEADSFNQEWRERTRAPDGRRVHRALALPSTTDVPRPPPAGGDRREHTHVASPGPGKRKQRPASLSGEGDDETEDPRTVSFGHTHHQHHKHARIQSNVTPHPRPRHCHHSPPPQPARTHTAHQAHPTVIGSTTLASDRARGQQTGTTWHVSPPPPPHPPGNLGHGRTNAGSTRPNNTRVRFQ